MHHSNQWRSPNADVKALTDRGLTVRFAPKAAEVHRRVAIWFDNQEVFDFVGYHLPFIAEPSMRHYIKAQQLKQTDGINWRQKWLETATLQDEADRAILGLLSDPIYAGASENERARAFTAMTGKDRATYFRRKARLPRCEQTPRPICQGSRLTLWDLVDNDTPVPGSGAILRLPDATTEGSLPLAA